MDLTFSRDVKRNLMDEGYINKAIIMTEVEVKKVRMYTEMAENEKTKKYFHGQEKALTKGLHDFKQSLTKLV